MKFRKFQIGDGSKVCIKFNQPSHPEVILTPEHPAYKSYLCAATLRNKNNPLDTNGDVYLLTI